MGASNSRDAASDVSRVRKASFCSSVGLTAASAASVIDTFLTAGGGCGCAAAKPDRTRLERIEIRREENLWNIGRLLEKNSPLAVYACSCGIVPCSFEVLPQG